MHHDTDSTSRIMAVADALFEEGGRAQFPTVDAVRKGAHVSMNDATSVMKAWRRTQLAGRRPEPVLVPPALHDLHRAGLEALWVAAQEHARQSLTGLQAAWDAERAEAEQLNREMLDAFEAQAAELEQAEKGRSALRERVATLESAANAHLETITGMTVQLHAAQAEARTHAARTADIERRTEELRTELERAHAAAAARTIQDAASQTELAGIRAEMSHLMQMIAGAFDGRLPSATDYSERKRQ